MRFTTLYFLFFFALVYVVFWIIPRRFRPHLIFVASLGFYAAWSWQFAVHLLLVLLVNYLALIRLLGRPRRSTLALIVVLNVVNLVFFKYFYFILGTASQAVGVIGPERLDAWLEHNLGVSHIVLPLAISFYTFQLIALQVDAYRGKIPEKPSIIEYLMFSLYFPHFVAGPIMRHSDFFYQLRNLKPDETRMPHNGAGYEMREIETEHQIFNDGRLFRNLPAVSIHLESDQLKCIKADCQWQYNVRHTKIVFQPRVQTLRTDHSHCLRCCP
jgi:D-alanyl-lipoteichoic acid acyltransferase DltB (MBOAT superfamily)